MPRGQDRLNDQEGGRLARVPGARRDGRKAGPDTPSFPVRHWRARQRGRCPYAEGQSCWRPDVPAAQGVGQPRMGEPRTEGVALRRAQGSPSLRHRSRGRRWKES